MIMNESQSRRPKSPDARFQSPEPRKTPATKATSEYDLQTLISRITAKNRHELLNFGPRRGGELL